MCASLKSKLSEDKRGIKIRLILLTPGGAKSEIRLIRTDTTLDLSQKAEKVSMKQNLKINATRLLILPVCVLKNSRGTD